MATATIVSAWQDATYAYVAATVPEAQTVDGAAVTMPVEYHAKTPLLGPGGVAFTLAQLKTNLTAALSAVRNAQLPVITAVAISGTITV